MDPNADVMTNLNLALDRCGIKMKERFVPECLHGDMDERFLCIRMNHYDAPDKASLYTRKVDIAGLVKGSDKILTKSTGKTVETCVDGIDGLIFWKNKVIAIKEHGCRDVATWCRIFNKDPTLTCCVCHDGDAADSSCNACQALCCHECNRKLNSMDCPVCRSENQFTLSAP